MTADLLPQVEFDETVNQWINTQTGQPVPPATIIAEINRLIDAAEEEVVQLTEDLYAGEIQIDEWEEANTQALKDAHLAQAALAAGGFAFLTGDAQLAVSIALTRQLTFLSGFSRDIVDGLTAGLALNRIRQYGNASQQSYWNQWNQQAAEQVGRQFDHLIPLPRIPGDGSTICRGNCRCFLSHHDRGIDWIPTAAESCGTCLDMEAGNPWGPMR